MAALNGANIEKGNDTKVSDLTSVVVQRQESKYSKVKHKKLPHPAQGLRDYMKKDFQTLI